jgi:hypothetical protein
MGAVIVREQERPRANPPASPPESSAVTVPEREEGFGGGDSARRIGPPETRRAAAISASIPKTRKRAIHSSRSAGAGDDRESRAAG